MHRFANPTRFLSLAAKLQPWMGVAGKVLLLTGVWLALVASPADYQQGEAVRMMYVHVPAAWMSLMVYTIMAGASAVFLIWRHHLADVAARAAAPLGAGFTFITLATGSLWGKPMWGTWWVWDARLTSVLVLFFLYIGYIAVANLARNEAQTAKACAILALVGFANIPIIKFSVEWWNTLHQPASIVRSGGMSIAPAMLAPLFTMAAAYLAVFLWLWLARIRAALLEAKARRLRGG